METNIEIKCMTWNDVVGLTQLTDNLRNAIKHNKISHAYLIQGERLSGKRMIADIFARALQCEGYKAPSEYQATLFDSEEQNSDISMKIRPCNQCKFCKQALNENHPDIIYVTHEKPNVISVDNIRQQVNAFCTKHLESNSVIYNFSSADSIFLYILYNIGLFKQRLFPVVFGLFLYTIEAA